MQTRKIGLILDLDHTLFDSHIRNRVVWIGGFDRWFNLFTRLNQLTAEKGFLLLFKIVSKKPNFDDLAGDAALRLRSFLSVENPHQYREGKDGLECLVNLPGRMIYLNLDPRKPSSYDIPPNAHSHITITNFEDKSRPIIEFARRHGIEVRNNILLDDTREVLYEAASKGIQTVSAEKFDPWDKFTEKLTEQEIAHIFEEIESKLIEKLHTIMASVLSAETKSLSGTSVSPTLFKLPLEAAAGEGGDQA